MPHGRLRRQAQQLKEAAITQAKTPGIDHTPAPSGYATYANPSRRGAQLGIRLSPGSATVAKAWGRGIAEHTKLANSGALRFLPASIRAEYLRRVARPFQPPPSPGVVAVIQQKEEQARESSGLVPREAASRLDLQKGINSIASLESQLKSAKTDAEQAANAVAQAARAGKPYEARVAFGCARNARVRSARLGRKIVELTATATRQAVIAGSIENLQKTGATPEKVKAIRAFEESHARMGLPENLVRIPEPVVNETEPEEIPREKTYVLDGLGQPEAVKNIVQQARMEAAATAAVVDSTYGAAAKAEQEILRLYDRAVHGGGALGGFGAFGQTSDRIARVAGTGATIAGGLVSIFTAFSQGQAPQPPRNGAAVDAPPRAVDLPEKRFPLGLVAAGVGGAALVGIGLAYALRS